MLRFECVFPELLEHRLTLLCRFVLALDCSIFLLFLLLIFFSSGFGSSSCLLFLGCLARWICRRASLDDGKIN